MTATPVSIAVAAIAEIFMGDPPYAKCRCNREQPYTKSSELKFLLEGWKYTAEDTNIV